MGKVWIDGVEIGTFDPQTEGTSGNVLINTTVIGTFTLAASGDVLLNATVVGTYTALVAEDFSISAVPDSLTIELNSYDTSVITVTSINAFNSAVTLSVSGAPTGVSTEFSENPITPPADGEATSILTVSTNMAIIGEYTLTVKGVSGALEHTVEILLRIIKVTPPPVGDDPKTILMTQLKANIAVFKDDEVTAAKVYVVFNIPPETIRGLLKTQYDAVITIGDPERDDVIKRATIDFHEAALYSVRCYCIDKTGITAKTLMWRLVREIWRVINASASSPGGQVRHWSISEGQVAEDIILFKQLLLCRRVRVKLFFVEAAKTSVLIQLTKVEIGYDATHKIELKGVGSIVWGDSDPWVPIEFPGAENITVFQHTKPVRIEGILECFDVDSFITAFYETDIQVAVGDQFAISESGARKKIEYFHVTGKKHDGSTQEYAFTGVRVRQVESPLLSVDEPKVNPFRVHFYAEKVEEFP